MSALSSDELRQYGNWVGQSPAEILLAVNLNGGWASVFPLGMPKEIHLVRNYFNEYPRELSKCCGSETKTLIDGLQRPDAASKWSLSGDFPWGSDNVFKDRASRVWFQMAPVAGAYHKGDGKPDNVDKALGLVASQSSVPYKLVSPDGTGGSSEIILLNPNKSKTLSSSAGAWVAVETRIDQKNETEGSYNYSETVIMGFDAHNLRDMQPHVQFGGEYQQVEIFAPLEARRFPAMVG